MSVPDPTLTELEWMSILYNQAITILTSTKHGVYGFALNKKNQRIQ